MEAKDWSCKLSWTADSSILCFSLSHMAVGSSSKFLLKDDSNFLVYQQIPMMAANCHGIHPWDVPANPT